MPLNVFAVLMSTLAGPDFTMPVLPLMRPAPLMVKLLLVGGVITELKNESVVKFRTLSFTPVALLKERRRPLRAMMNCDGPTAPMVSGGKPEQSDKVAAR